MAQEPDLRALARRVVGRVLSERGRREHPVAHAPSAASERTAGVHVHIAPVGEPLRPEHELEARSKEPPAELVTVESLASVPDGGRLSLARGARVTALAREEAWRRQIALVEGPLSPAEARREDGRRRIAVASDHGGFALKTALCAWLRERGEVVLDLGTHDENAVDYPDFAHAAAEAVARGRADLAVVIDGAGIGSTMTANKVPGIRAANCWNVASARNAREHNFANVLGLGARLLEPKDARAVLEAFLTTPYGAARHAARVDKLHAYEQRYARAPESPARRPR